MDKVQSGKSTDSLFSPGLIKCFLLTKLKTNILHDILMTVRKLVDHIKYKFP